MFERLGGEEGLFRLVDRFYAHMRTSPEAGGILGMHPDLERARTKLWAFLCGRFGGPNHYVERWGHPRLRARHMPFAIGESEARQWMTCMDRALGECVEDAELRAELRNFFAMVAEHMRNDRPPG